MPGHCYQHISTACQLLPLVIALKAALVWLGIALLGILNGLIRDLLFAPVFGSSIALPLSGISLAIIIFAVTFITIDFIGAADKQACYLVGFQWVVMTLVFELIFGHYLMGRQWPELLQVFNLAHGNLFLLALLACFISPYVIVRIRT